MVYLVVCLLIILFSYLDVVQKSKVDSMIYALFVASIMVIMAALRDNVGTDWLAYYEFYTHGGERTEIGYRTFNDLFHDLGLHYNYLLLFFNVVSLGLIVSSLRRHAVYIVIGLLIFYSDLFLYFNFSGIRQAMAISFTLFSVKYAIDRNFIKFLLCVILAATFHVTAMVFLIIYFIPFRQFSKKEYIFIAAAFGLFSIFIFSLINVFSGELALKAKFYLELQEQESNIKTLFLIGAIKRSLIFFVVLIFGKELAKLRNSVFFLNIYLIGFVMYLTTYLISPDIGVRLSSYFLIFDLFLAGNLIMINKKLSTRLFIMTFFAIISIYKISTYMGLEPYSYKTIFN